MLDGHRERKTKRDIGIVALPTQAQFVIMPSACGTTSILDYSGKAAYSSHP
jgi:hypothetical protein